MSWADSEFQDASFGDDRLRQRAIRVCERLAEHPSESIPVACCGRAEVEAAYRFFSNDKVTAARITSRRTRGRWNHRAIATSLLTQSIGEGCDKPLCAEEGS